MTDTTTSIIAALNTYTGDNIWQDVIEHTDYDRSATEAADPSAASDVIVMRDGTVIRYSQATRVWE